MAYICKTMSLALLSTVFILASSLSHSWAHHDTKDKDDSQCDLCLHNYRPQECWQIVKDNHDGFSDDGKKAAYTAIDLARGKAHEILDLLNQLQSGSTDDDLKGKYQSCVNNYNNVIRDIDQARSLLDSNESICNQLHTVLDDFEECRHKFNKGENDPAHILNRNHEFFVYGQLAKAVGEKLDKKN